MTRVLVVSPHPDDESIGAGGALARHAAQGDRIEVVFLTSGEAGGHGLAAGEAARVREREARRAARRLGVSAVEFWREPDGRLAASRALVARLGHRLGAARLEVVYTTHGRELHPDHRAAWRLVRAAVAALPRRSRPGAVLGFEVWSPLARFDVVVDVTRFVAAKRAAIRCYRSQCRVLAFDDAMLGLARYRGEMHCWPEGDYAEVFVRAAP